MAVISREKPKQNDAGLVVFFLRYVLMALGLTAVAFAVLAAVYIFVDIPVHALEIITLVVSVIVALVVSFMVGKDSATPLSGGCVTLVYTFLRCAVSVIFGFTPILSVRTPFELITGFLIGLLGGILGSGGGNRRRRYR